MATCVKFHHSAAFRRHELSNLIQETFANRPSERNDHILWVIQNETKRDLYQRFHSKDRCQIIQELLHIGPLPDECIGKAIDKNFIAILVYDSRHTFSVAARRV